MRRMLWLGIGLAVGGLVVRAVNKKAKALSPGGIAGSARKSAVGALGSVRTFVDDVRAAAAEREAEIRAAIHEGATVNEDLYVEEGKHRR
jgi:hypothetical protein